jgi:hypothetical protein
MASSKPVDELSTEEFEYIAAVIADETYEFDISKDGEYSLFTDWEGDGHFLPTITILHEVSEDEKQAEREKIETLLSDYDWFTYQRVTEIDVEEQNGISHAYFSDESIDSDIKKGVLQSSRF